jgi:ribosomal 50S subunit-associated protein YjgA (DUF615 family)
MDVKTLEEQLEKVCDEESEETVSNVKKVRKTVQRRLKNLSAVDYNNDEIIFGGAMAIAYLLQDVPDKDREHYVEIVSRIVRI